MQSIVNEDGSGPDADPVPADAELVPETGPDASVDQEQREIRVGRWPFPLALLVAVGFWWGADFDPLNAAFTAALIVLFPVVAVAQLGVDLRILPKRTAYGNSIGTILVLAGLSLVLGVWRFGWAGMGLGAADLVSVGLWSVGLTVLGMTVLVLFTAARRALGFSESPFLRYMLPVTPSERRLFAVLSFSAGIGEELVYRSYLIAVLAVVLPGEWTAAVLATVLFAAVHAYQGVFGMVRTAVLGLVLSMPLLLTGVIWPAMVAHTAIDLLAGLVFADRLTDSPDSPTPPQTDRRSPNGH